MSNRYRFWPLATVLLVILIASPPAHSQTHGAPVTGCDRIAADPWDRNRVAEGIGFSEIDGAQAVEACEKAIQEYPESVRLRYQYGRSLLAREWDWLRHPDVDPAPSIQRAAVKGYAPAQYLLGFLHEKGYGVEKGFDLALRQYLSAAEGGYAPAQRYVGKRYKRGYTIGLTVKPNYEKALHWLGRAADQGHPYAQAELGNLYDNNEDYGYESDAPQDYAKAAHWYRKAAQQGHPFAQRDLGYLYRVGRRGERNCAKAATWFQRTIEGASKARTEKGPHESVNFKKATSEAMHYLGSLYLMGCGIEQNNKKGGYWIYRAASEYYNAKAQAKLGYLFLEGRGVAHDPAKGYKWLSQAGRNGHECARLDAALLAAVGEGTARNPSWALTELDLLRKNASNETIRRVAAHHARSIRQANPGARSWNQFRPKRHRASIGATEVLLGLVVLGMLLNDGDNSGEPTTSYGGPNPYVAYGDNISLNHPGEVNDMVLLLDVE